MYCGAAAQIGATSCGTCGQSLRDPEGDAKREEWARAAAERDAAWHASSPARPAERDRAIETSPCKYCGAAVQLGATACGTCGRSLAQGNAEGDAKREEWARAAAERDAAWQQQHGLSPAEPAIETSPCTYCGSSVKIGASACGTCGRSLAQGTANAGSGQARPRRDTLRGNSTPSARPSPEAPPSPARRNGLLWGLVFVGVCVAMGTVAAVVLSGSKTPKPASPVAVTPPVAPPPAETPASRVANAKTFAQAIALARPAFTDTTDELGDGAKLLANYAAKKLRWDEVHVPAETTLARVEKDPQLERGKRLCVTGEVARIARRDLGDRRVYVGHLRTAENDEVAFVAAGTTGDLVKRSTGTLCGAALGMSGDAVSIFGMFDLAENRMPLVEQ